MAWADWQDSGLVFTSPIGTALDARNVLREFHDVLNVAGCPPSGCTTSGIAPPRCCSRKGVDSRTIMETLGHSQISLTMNTYAHVLPALQEAAADSMDAILRASKDSTLVGVKVGVTVARDVS